jgi:hypothetical protein
VRGDPFLHPTTEIGGAVVGGVVEVVVEVVA